MDMESLEADVWESVNQSLYLEQANDGTLCFTVGETWLGALYGVEENVYGQRAIHLFDNEVEQLSWFYAASIDLHPSN